MKPDSHFRPDIEGLRGISILLVVLFHAGVPFFTGGFIGVDVFFVLSGYLITGLLLNELEKTETIRFSNFYARRARRLLPASAVMLFFVVVASFIIFPPIQQQDLPETALSTAGYVSNFYFLANSTNYLGAPPESNPLLHTWSLSVEEQFYFVFPLLMLLAFKLKRRIGLLILMITVCVLSFALCVWMTSYIQPWAFFSSPTRAWEFAAGALAVTITNAHSKRIDQVIGFFGLILILIAGFYYSASTTFPGITASVPVIGTIAVLRAGQETLVGKFLSNRILTFFGKLSYSWYLWHWVVLVLAKGYRGSELFLTSKLGCIIFAFALAYLSYKFIENPIRFHPKITKQASHALAMAGIITILGLCCGLCFRYVSSRAKESSAQIRFANAKQDLPSDLKGCEVRYADSDLKECDFGGGTKILALIGDSHAGQWYSAAQTYAIEKNMKLVVMTKARCSPLDVTYTIRIFGRQFYECEQWREKLYQRISELQPEIIIMSNYLYADINEDTTGLTVEKWTAGLKSSIQTLKKSSSHVIYLRDTPHPGFDQVECLAKNKWQFWHPDLNCSFSKSAVYNAEINKLEQETTQNEGGVFLDMNADVCPAEICEAETDDVIKYRDNNHLSNTFVKRLAPVFKNKIDTAINKP